MAALSILRTTDLRKHYGGIRALDGVSLAVAEGELLGIIGPNGSGKSTLFDCITGLVTPDGGQVELRGEAITGLPLHAVAARGLVRSFQRTAVFRSLTVLDNLVVAGQAQAFGGTLPAFSLGGRARRTTAQLEARARELLVSLSLNHMANVVAGALSFGQQKLVQFASSLMLNPRIILLDEPLAGVNPVRIEQMTGWIRKIHATQGTTFVIIEHRIDVLLALCQRVVVLARGKKLTEGTPAEVTADPRVVEAYLGG